MYLYSSFACSTVDGQDVEQVVELNQPIAVEVTEAGGPNRLSILSRHLTASIVCGGRRVVIRGSFVSAPKHFRVVAHSLLLKS